MLPFTATQDALQSLIQPLSAEEWANYLYNKEQEAQQSGGMVCMWWIAIWRRC